MMILLVITIYTGQLHLVHVSRNNNCVCVYTHCDDVLCICIATGRDPARERLLENEKNNFKLVADKVYTVHLFISWYIDSLSGHLLIEDTSLNQMRPQSQMLHLHMLIMNTSQDISVIYTCVCVYLCLSLLSCIVINIGRSPTASSQKRDVQYNAQ